MTMARIRVNRPDESDRMDMWFESEKADRYEGRDGSVLWHTAAALARHEPRLRQWVLTSPEGAHARVRDEDEVKRWLLANGYLMKVAEVWGSRVSEARETRQSVSFDPEMVAWIDRRAAERGARRSEEIRALLAYARLTLEQEEGKVDA